MVLPEIFISRTKDLLGDEWEAFLQSLNSNCLTSIRLNPKKKFLPEDFLPMMQKISWASNAFYLDSRPVFTLDPFFHAGCYYVQEASSMFLEQIIKKHFPLKSKVLDLCAAPGGKSTQLASLLPDDSLLVANEVIRSRAFILSENLIKWGSSNTIVTNSDPVAFGKLNGFFDVIVADVPCSGEGMFRKDPAAIREWSVNNVQLCAERQRRIIADAWDALRPSGLLVYSTCTYNREENERNIEWICSELGAETVETPQRFMPHRTKGEGFFIAAMKKNPGYSVQSPVYNAKLKVKPALINIERELLVDLGKFSFFSENNTSIAFPAIHYDDFIFLKNRLKIVSAGIALGETKGKDFIPNHALAMSTELSTQPFPVLELEKADALKYLRKESLQEIPNDLPRGHVLVKYKNCPLGFIKNIGNRANNLYPQEWRVRIGN